MSSPGLLHRARTTIVRHPVVTALLVVGTLVVLGLAQLIGLDSYFVIPILAVVGGLAWLLARWWNGRRPEDEDVPAAKAGRVGLAAVAVASVLTFLLIQAVPYGRAHDNAEGTGEPEWATPRTRELMVGACYDCHSNETEYPPYASVAPISWMVQRHVDEGRSKVNYSDFATDPGDADESVEVLLEGEMPPSYFTRFGLHPEANLSEAELAELVAGLRATPGMSED
jgi:mono/diheme cytochrome c family protein